LDLLLEFSVRKTEELIFFYFPTTISILQYFLVAQKDMRENKIICCTSCVISWLSTVKIVCSVFSSLFEDNSESWRGHILFATFYGQVILTLSAQN
jgi:hypothetical protein